MYIFIKNMVCVRCKMAVQAVLENLGIAFTSIELGKVDVPGVITSDQFKALDTGLRHYELEILENKKDILVERIKSLIIEMIHDDTYEPLIKLSAFLSRELGYEYTYLANIFSDHEESTIERFYITSRIDRVKELIVYEGMSIKEIAFRLNYSSVSHLCLQFKKVEGVTPSSFKKLSQSSDFVWKKCE